jgi:hypothetical protein
MTEDPLDAHRRAIAANRKRIEEFSNRFDVEAKQESDEFKRYVKHNFSLCLLTMEQIYKELETLVLAQGMLKRQTEILKDIVIQLQEVKQNPMMQEDIRKYFKDYNSSF